MEKFNYYTVRGKDLIDMSMDVLYYKSSILESTNLEPDGVWEGYLWYREFGTYKGYKEWFKDLIYGNLEGYNV